MNSRLCEIRQMTRLLITPARDHSHRVCVATRPKLSGRLLRNAVTEATSGGLCVPMLYKTYSAAVYGIDANIIEVEVDVSGIKTKEDHFHAVGLPDAAVRESRDRVRSALRNCGYHIPPTHFTVNLRPAFARRVRALICPGRLEFWALTVGSTKRNHWIACSSANSRSMAGSEAFAARSRSRLRHAAGRSRN